MLDLDHFKRYNDTHGHQGGDDLLRSAVAAWQAELRPNDTLARYGGEEFLAVLPATDAAAAMVVAERLRGALPDHVTASAGTATWDPGETPAALIARADAALYQAKAAGRARTVASAPPEAAV
jgi:diguanylate cyclase (GGDEF)-like protein